jgi:hypothetical protein
MKKEVQAACYIARQYRWAISVGLSHDKAIDLIVKPKACSSRFSDEFDRGISGLRRDKRLQEYWRGGHEKFTIVWPDIREASKHDSIIIPPKRIETKQKAKVGRPSNYYLKQHARKNPNA